MKWQVMKTVLEPIGRDRDDSMIHWHKAVMRVVATVEAPTAAKAIKAAKEAGYTAPIVQLKDDGAAARFLSKIRSMARPAREMAEVA
jgi:hypothetical protein